VCERLNELKKIVYDRQRESDSSMLLIEADFHPHPEMSEEYFLPVETASTQHGFPM
jgi:hypothetical protein